MARHRRRASLPATPTAQQEKALPEAAAPAKVSATPAVLSPSAHEPLSRSVRRDLVLIALWGGGAVILLVVLAILDRLGGGSVSGIFS